MSDWGTKPNIFDVASIVRRMSHQSGSENLPVVVLQFASERDRHMFRSQVIYEVTSDIDFSRPPSEMMPMYEFEAQGVKFVLKVGGR